MNKTETETDLNFIADGQDMDYPAAHSMDTTWFAVDKDGYIAVMDTEEVGAVPCLYTGDQGDGSEVLRPLAKMKGKALPDELYEVDLSKVLGLYVYRSGIGFYPPGGDETLDPDEEYEDIVEAYERQGVPDEPLHVSELPENFQAEVKHAAIFDISFRDSPWLQPALKVPCEFWLTEEVEPRAVDVDGKLKVIPKELRRENAPRGTHKSQLSTPGEEESPKQSFWKKLFGG